jgi:hypothetical protein
VLPTVVHAERVGEPVDEALEPSAEAAPAHAVPVDPHIPVFGGRKRAKELAGEVARLREDLDRIGGLSLIEVEERRLALESEVKDEAVRLDTARRDAEAMLERSLEEARAKTRKEIDETEKERQLLRNELQELRSEVVETREVALLQEAGIYEYRHPLSDAVAYQAELALLRNHIKAMVRADGGAVLGSTTWSVNNSAAQGRKLVRDFSKLMLRAYNAEADNLVRGLKPYRLPAAVERLAKVASTIERLGATMGIRVSDEYQRLRIRELQLTADYVAKLAEEKEREREERARLSEERKAQQELERERLRLEKERQHYTNALVAVAANSDLEGVDRMRAKLAEIERAISDVDYRAANIRAGYVYVISNLGSFGERIVKIGMTRRLEPLERVRELGDASVPFRYDVHALFFSDDAVGIESTLHARLAEKRVNRVNNRREFFYATPHEVKAQLLELTGELLNYEEVPEALEFRQSQNLEGGGGGESQAVDEVLLGQAIGSSGTTEVAT